MMNNQKIEEVESAAKALLADLEGWAVPTQDEWLASLALVKIAHKIGTGTAAENLPDIAPDLLAKLLDGFAAAQDDCDRLGRLMDVAAGIAMVRAGEEKLAMAAMGATGAC